MGRKLPGEGIVQIEISKQLKGERGREGIIIKNVILPAFSPNGISVFPVGLIRVGQGIRIPIASFRIHNTQEVQMQGKLGIRLGKHIKSTFDTEMASIAGVIPHFAARPVIGPIIVKGRNKFPVPLSDGLFNPFGIVHGIAGKVAEGKGQGIEMVHCIQIGGQIDAPVFMPWHI